jgi:Flp pilus assembly protein protease CpaA
MDLSATSMDLIARMGIVIWLGLCAYYDARTGEIPNLLTLPALAMGGLMAAISGIQALAFYAVVLLLLFFVYYRGDMGGADVKILGALAGMWPLGLMTVMAGIFIWMIGRRILGRRGNFRAGLLIALAAAAMLLMDSIMYFS